MRILNAQREQENNASKRGNVVVIRGKYLKQKGITEVTERGRKEEREIVRKREGVCVWEMKR